MSSKTVTKTKFDLNFDVPLLDENDKPIIENGQEVKIKDILIINLKNDPESKDAIKYFTWCIDLARTGTVSLDKEDKKLLESFVKGQVTISTNPEVIKHNRFKPLVIYRIMEIIDK